MFPGLWLILGVPTPCLGPETGGWKFDVLTLIKVRQGGKEREWLVPVILGCPQCCSGAPVGAGGGSEVVVARFSG